MLVIMPSFRLNRQSTSWKGDALPANDVKFGVEGRGGAHMQMYITQVNPASQLNSYSEQRSAMKGKYVKSLASSRFQWLQHLPSDPEGHGLLRGLPLGTKGCLNHLLSMCFYYSRMQNRQQLGEQTKDWKF